MSRDLRITAHHLIARSVRGADRPVACLPSVDEAAKLRSSLGPDAVVILFLGNDAKPCPVCSRGEDVRMVPRRNGVSRDPRADLFK